MIESFSSYPTYMVFLAVLLSGALTIAAMPFWIRALKYKKIGQQIRADGPQGHLIKQGTPTMGGVIMLLAITLTIVFVGHFTRSLTLLLCTTLLFGVLGFIDDATKVVKERSLGLTPTQKLILQALLCISFTLLAVNWVGITPVLDLPFTDASIDLGILTTTLSLGEETIDIPWLYLIFVFFLMAGLSNSVNLTDGLDGLAGGSVMIVMLVMAAIAYRQNLLDPALFAGAIAGACVGFLWFNAWPAKIFMGDTGSLALGAALSALAVLTGTEVVTLIIGGLFVCESLSVIIQVCHFKRTGKRVFLMSPIHHHFEKKGWSETTVVIRFWIVSAAFACVGFVSYFVGTI